MYPIRNRIPLVTPLLDHELLVQQAHRLTTTAMHSEDQALIISKLALLFPEDRKDLITQVLPVITDTMSVQDRMFLINRLSFMRQDERELLIRQALTLLSDSMSDQDRIFIINKLSFMSACERDLVVMQALRLIKDDMSAKDRRAIIEGKILLLHRKYRFRISSHEIIENPIKILLDIFETFVRNPIQISLYSIEYIDAQTIDDGGLMRSFVAKLTESFCNAKYSLVTETELGVIPTLNNTESFLLSLEDQEKCFKTIGRFFSTALQQYNFIVLGQNFHPIVFEMIFSLTVEDLAKLDSQEVFDKMFLVWLLQERNIDERMGKNIVKDKITKEVRDIYCINSKAEFIKMYRLEEKIKAILILTRSIYDSLSNKGEWETLKGNSATTLREKIQGTISKEDVIKVLSLDDLDKVKETSVQYIKKWVTETSTERLIELVEAISGIKTLSRTTKLNVSGVKGMDKLPVFYMCFSRIELSEYTSYKIFKERLEVSLDHCLIGSGFQMA
ncbi:MAG: hypothetical protein ACRCSV_01770 [Chlamydiales bacterium]